MIHTHKYKISAKTHFYFMATTQGLHVSTSSSHHKALQGTDPSLPKFPCTLGCTMIQSIKSNLLCHTLLFLDKTKFYYKYV